MARGGESVITPPKTTPGTAASAPTATLPRPSSVSCVTCAKVRSSTHNLNLNLNVPSMPPRLTVASVTRQFPPPSLLLVPRTTNVLQTSNVSLHIRRSPRHISALVVSIVAAAKIVLNFFAPSFRLALFASVSASAKETDDSPSSGLTNCMRTAIVGRVQLSSLVRSLCCNLFE